MTAMFSSPVPSAEPSHDAASAAVISAQALGTMTNEGFASLAVGGADVLIGAKEGSGSALLAIHLTHGGATSGTFSGNGPALTNLTAGNLTGQVSSAQLDSNLTPETAD